MKIEKAFLKPRAKTFFGLWVLTFLAFLLFALIVNLFTQYNFFASSNMLVTAVMMATGNAGGVMLGVKRVRLTVSDVDNLENIKDQALDFLSHNDLKIAVEKEDEITFRPTSYFYRFYNNWLGLEIVSVKQVEEQLVIEGPPGRLEGLGSKIGTKLVLI